jgi:hypothetical protein
VKLRLCHIIGGVISGLGLAGIITLEVVLISRHVVIARSVWEMVVINAATIVFSVVFTGFCVEPWLNTKFCEDLIKLKKGRK